MNCTFFFIDDQIHQQQVDSSQELLQKPGHFYGHKNNKRILNLISIHENMYLMPNLYQNTYFRVLMFRPLLNTFFTNASNNPMWV